MWGIMKDEEEEVTWGFHIHLKMLQQHPEPTQQPRCVFDKSYDCPDELRGGETCSAFWSVLTTHKHTHTLARGQAYTHSCRHRYTLHEFTGYRAWMGTQAFFTVNDSLYMRGFALSYKSSSMGSMVLGDTESQQHPSSSPRSITVSESFLCGDRQRRSVCVRGRVCAYSMVSSRYLVHWFSCRALVKSRSLDSCRNRLG